VDPNFIIFNKFLIAIIEYTPDDVINYALS